MDTNLAKTFLTIVEAGTFKNASEKLNVTQSTISVRIKALEEKIGATLFVRNKSGVVLTQAGVHFQEYAISFVQLWERAVRKVATEDIYSENISIGVRPGLWEPIVMSWLPWAKSNFNNIAYRVEFGIADDLISKLANGTIDITILFSPPSIPGIVVEELYQEKFKLVASPEHYPKTIPVNEISIDQYLEVDWGKEFNESLNNYFPTPKIPHLSVNLGLYGIKYLKAYGGCGYFAESMVKEYIEEGSLIVVKDAPVIKQSAYIAYNHDNNREHFSSLIEGFRVIGRNIH